MMVLVWIVCGAGLGGAAAWAVAEGRRNKLAAALITVRAQLESALQRLAEQMASSEQRLNDSRQHYEARLKDAALSEDRLRTQLEVVLPRVADSVLGAKSDQLYETARSDFQLIEQQTVSKVNESNLRLAAVVEEMKQRVDAYQVRLSELDRQRLEAATRIDQQVNAVLVAGQSLASEARTLKEALRTSHGVRGRWGEAVLKNILDSCGLNEGIDYELQASLTDGEARLRPDAIIHLPSGRDLIIDSKASLSGFLEAADELDEERRRARLNDFAVVLRRRADELASREYSRNLANSLPCVVMFVPSEAAFRAALDADAELFRYGQDKRPAVLLASPTSLFPLISVVAHGWQQHIMEKKSQQLAAEVTRFTDALRVFFDHVQKIGKSLDATGRAYNDALASFRSRIAPKIEKLSELSPQFAQLAELQPLQKQLELSGENGSDEAGAPAETPRIAAAGG